MAMTAPERLKAQVRCAYEWGRFRHAVLWSSMTLVLTGISVAVSRAGAWSVVIGGVLFLLTTVLMWYGGVATRAARAGLQGGVLAFAIPIGVFHGYLGAHAGIAAVLTLNAITGVGMGILLSIRSARLQRRRNGFLLGAGTVVVLSGALGCLFFGAIGAAGLAIGYAASTAPVMVYRGATA